MAVGGGSVAVAGEAARCVPPHKTQALLALLCSHSTQGLSKQTFTSNVESRINHAAFFLAKRRGKKNLAAVKISKKSHLKTKDAEVTWAEGQSYVLPLYFFKSIFVDFFQILHCHTAIRDQLFRCTRNGSAKRLLRGHLRA